MSKHTPGPWVAGRIFEESRWVEIYKIKDNGMPSLPFAACKHFDEEANARLIAAAPDLLDVLKELAALDFGALIMNDDDERRIDFVARKARTAIAKAEGGAA